MMAIRWSEAQRAYVADVLKRFDYKSDRCAAAARGVLPVARQVDDKAVGLRLAASEGAPFILSKPPKSRQFYHHVLVEADAHRVDAFTGEDGFDADRYLERYWQHHEHLFVSEVDVETIDVGIQRGDEP